jgi:hypothetical protein
MVPSRLSVSRIAMGVFVGNLLCMLISFLLFACTSFGMTAFGFSLERFMR